MDQKWTKQNRGINNGISRRHFLQSAAGAPLLLASDRSINLQDEVLAQSLKTAGFKSLPLESIDSGGDLLTRARLNFRRLHDEPFRYNRLARTSMPDSPGDALGRTILGLTLLARTIKEKPLYLEEIVRRLPESLNAKGYIGEINPDGVSNESQICGHTSLLRGLNEYFLWKKDASARRIVGTVTANLLIAAKANFKSYPSDPAKELKEGGVIGASAGAKGNWRGLNTDIGQVFMVLDGVTQSYQLWPSPELKETIEAIIGRYSEIDLKKMGAQTHSQLSALRGILRYYVSTGEGRYLNLVMERFRLYKEHAWTENYENYNWFGRPDWTEACGVIDSFMLAVQLWKTTGQTAYLNDAHLIYYNAMIQGQRPNGGFGTNVCVGAKGQIFLKPRIRTFEAPWCCTMRGGEGLARAIQYSYFTDKHSLVIPFFGDNTVDVDFPDGGCTLRQSTSYPFEGKIHLSVLKSTSRSVKNLNIFIPPWVLRGTIKVMLNGSKVNASVANNFLTVKSNLAPGDTIGVYFDQRLGSAGLVHVDKMSGYHRFFHGPLLLGVNTTNQVKLSKNSEFIHLGRARYRVKGTRMVVGPINDLTYMSEKEARESSKQVLFTDE